MTQEMNWYRKAPPPTLGTSFEGSIPDWVRGPAPNERAPVLMFDLDRLGWRDYQEMRWHPQVNASLSLITFMLHQMDWKIECADPKIAQVVEENLRLIWTPLIRGLSQAYWAGFSPMILEWDNTSDGRHTFITKIKDLHPGEAWIHWREEESNYRPPPEYSKTIPPKVKIYDGIKRYGLGYPIPPEHTLWYPVMREHNDWTGRKLLKAAYTPWYFSHLIHLYSNRYFERFGEPVPVGRAPLNDQYTIPGTDQVITGKQVIEEALMNLRSGISVSLPSSRDMSASGVNEFEYSIEYLESQMRGADFERYMDRLDEEISLAIFTPLLLLRAGDRGSLNLGVQHTRTWLWSLNALGADIKEYVDEYICERIKAINFSPNAPRCEWVPRMMGKDNDETLRSILVQLISKDKVTPDIEELGVALGMTLEEISLLDMKKLTEVRTPPQPPQEGPDNRDREERSRQTDGPSTTTSDPPGTTRT